ncbi:MAG: glycosyltransferase, partial [Acetobacteraceae bacterium]|nr:glycosyltransferase [Acetobacteraceae bacterium]
TQLRRLRKHEGLRRALLEEPERTAAEVDGKLALLAAEVPTHLIDRVPHFQAMARLERRRGNDLIAATYLLRAMRWGGEDRRGDLPFVAQTLATHGFPREAATAEAMFGPQPEREARCLDILRGAYDANRSKPAMPLAALDDRRGTATPCVAVIASLYNAADKLPTLLRMLARQSIAQQGALEVVLVDSNSPSDERGAFAAFAAAHPDLPMVFARSAERETIQAAWNRGIHLSRAPYLSFLGADEGLHPDALRQLAAALDADASVDWAMADSLVTSVDRHGVYDSDVMTYDRRGFRQDLVYLETCYLSWVGGLYRRSIHDRFGLYDESYRAAGDTEFKNRIMPHIRSVHVPRMLGVFNNYPEERTTQHPRAEIEDLRAWYLWRSEAGMRYAFTRRPVEDALALLRDCFGYRKSFCGHLSTDFDLAGALGRYVMSRPDAPPEADAVARAAAEGEAALRALDALQFDTAPDRLGIARTRLGWRQLHDVLALAPAHQAALGLASPPPYAVFNDNRYEQHWWSWSAV